MSTDAITQMAHALAQRGSRTPQQARRERNRRYYERRRDWHQWRWKLQRLERIGALFTSAGEVSNANH